MDYLHRVFRFLIDFSLVHLQTLIKRILPLIKDNAYRWDVWIAILATLPLLVKKDRDDAESPLFVLFPEFQSYIENASIDSILRLTNTLIACDRLNYIFTNKVNTISFFMRTINAMVSIRLNRCSSIFPFPFALCFAHSVYDIVYHCAVSENGKRLCYIAKRNSANPTGHVVRVFNGISQCSRHIGIESASKCCIRKRYFKAITQSSCALP